MLSFTDMYIEYLNAPLKCVLINANFMAMSLSLSCYWKAKEELSIQMFFTNLKKKIRNKNNLFAGRFLQSVIWFILLLEWSLSISFVQLKI